MTYKRSNFTLLASLLVLSGCSFVEDRSADPVQIVDASNKSVQVIKTAPSKPIVSPPKEYRVKKNDTLGTIAQEMMGSSRHYKELAQFNSLDYKTPLKIGQLLLIPNSTNRSVFVEPLTRPTKTVNSTTQKAYPELDTLIEARKYNQAIDWALTHPELNNSENLQSKLAQASILEADTKISEQNFSEANFLIQGLLQKKVLSPTHEMALTTKSKQIQCHQLSNQALLLAEKKDFETAYNQLKEAQNLDAAYSSSIKNYSEATQIVSEEMHQRALKLYRNQELNSALNIWERILVIKPNDDLALVYTDRVKNLKKKLNDL